MRTTIVLDDELLAKAQVLTNLHEKSALAKEALKALIERESAKKLANLGGSEHEMKSVPRKQPPDFPVISVGEWPDDLSLRREDLYGDDGR
ncbi:MAG: type II toxin-antitoxin system VapB family antitoxin [Methylomonas sp.]|jgi:hypothetical protein